MVGFWGVVRGLHLSRPEPPDSKWRVEALPQPEPKALRNVAWSLSLLAVMVVTFPVWSTFHNSAMLGIGLVGLIAFIAFLINLPWAVKQFIRR